MAIQFPQKNPRVAVIGAGCSGITAVKNLLQVGLKDIVCYEKNARLGGNWLYSEDNEHSSVCETTHIISSKTMSAYTDFPMPADYPDYPSHAQVLRYFESYAEHFGLLKYIQFSTSVHKAEQLAENRWRLTLSDGKVEEFDALIVANGHHNTPRWPNYKGKFTGNWLHSHHYKHNRDEHYINKRVLVIGAGNSGCDCAVEISRVAEKVGISMRHGHYIVPKFFLGKPTDTFNKALIYAPEIIAGPLRSLTHWLQIGSYNDYGLENPPYSLLKGHPTINSELLYKIKHGKVKPHKGIDRLDGLTVHFSDGTSEEYDTIVCATGYYITTPFFDKDFLSYEEADRIPLYLRTFHPKLRSLFFVGLVQPQGAIWPLSDLHAQLVANHLVGNLSLPDDIERAAEKDSDFISKEFTKSPRHTVEVHYHQHRTTLEKALPPNMKKWASN